MCPYTIAICQCQQNSHLQLLQTLPNHLKILIAAGLNKWQLPPLPDSLIKISLRETQADHLPNRWPANLKILKFVHGYEFDDDLSSVAKLSIVNSDIPDLILNGCSHLVSTHVKGCNQLVNIDLANCLTCVLEQA